MCHLSSVICHAARASGELRSHTMTDLLLAIDVGTGSVRAALVTQSGRILAFAAKEHDQTIPRYGWSQQNPLLWWEGAVLSIRTVLDQVKGAADRIAGIAACGQMHGTVLIDASGEPVLEEVPLWNDKRTRELVNRFLAEQDPKDLFPIVANPPTVAWPAFKLAWIKENRTAAYDAAKTVLMPKDYINFRLTGECRTDFSEASSSYMFDTRTRDWSPKMLALLGLDQDRLPPIGLASEPAGAVTKEAATITGLRPGTPVAIGTGDFPAALLGAGAIKPGTSCDITGTSNLITLVTEEPVFDPIISNMQIPTGGWAAFTVLDAAGDALRWARHAFNRQHPDTYDQVLALAEGVPAGSEQLLFLPYLNGERLGRRTNSRGQFFGISTLHGVAHLYRAIMEGVAFASRKNLDLMKSRGQRFNRIIAAAGGAKSPLWLEIKASIYNTPILRTAEPECGLLGCAMLAGCVAGLFSDLGTTVSQLVRYEKEILPRPDWFERYEKMQLLFNELYESSGMFWDLLEE